MNAASKSVNRFLENCSNQVQLQSYNTLAIPSVAEKFIDITDCQQLLAFTRFQQHQKTNVFILGGGSNIVLPDKVDALVARISTKGRAVIAETNSSITIKLSAGENWHDSVMWSVDSGYWGIENLALIPGTVGAAPIQNIGAYGVEIADVLLSLEGINYQTGEQFSLTKEQCKFAYRDSIFKNTLANKTIITHVTLVLSKHAQACLDYPALAAAVDTSVQLSPRDIANAVIAIRQAKLPDPTIIPNAGSFFKNPIIDKQSISRLKDEYPDIVFYPNGDKRVKVAAAWLLETAGWKGRPVDGIAMHEKQALVLTNPHQRTGKDILGFAKRIQQDILQRFGIELHIEPQIIVS
ncbi:MAG: UDP-N-acetylmuramate dehydrogenase [Pseudomonadota bacterium]